MYCTVVCTTRESKHLSRSDPHFRSSLLSPVSRSRRLATPNTTLNTCTSSQYGTGSRDYYGRDHNAHASDVMYISQIEILSRAGGDAVARRPRPSPLSGLALRAGFRGRSTQLHLRRHWPGTAQIDLDPPSASGEGHNSHSWKEQPLMRSLGL